MPKYIDVDLLISELKSLNEQERLEYMGVYDCIKSVPTADVQEVQHGKWNLNRIDYDWVYYACSKCGYSNVFNNENYCPECGAKMDGKEEKQ